MVSTQLVTLKANFDILATKSRKISCKTFYYFAKKKLFYKNLPMIVGRIFFLNILEQWKGRLFFLHCIFLAKQ